MGKNYTEGCIEQTCRLFKDRLYGDNEILLDEKIEFVWMIGRWILKFNKKSSKF